MSTSIAARLAKLARHLPQKTVVNVVRRHPDEAGIKAGEIEGEFLARTTHPKPNVTIRYWERPATTPTRCQAPDFA